MKKTLVILASALLFHETSAYAASSFADQSQTLTIELEAPKAGWDFPTDTPLFPELKGKLILAINAVKRIVVDGDSQLVEPEAGVDYPTDSPEPAELSGVQILVLKKGVRLPLKIELAVAGLDYPTDGPGNLERDFLVWDMGEGQRVRLTDIRQVMPAVAGLDYPTDGPGTLERDFYIYTRTNADFSISRIVIRSTH